MADNWNHPASAASSDTCAFGHSPHRSLTTASDTQSAPETFGHSSHRCPAAAGDPQCAPATFGYSHCTQSPFSTFGYHDGILDDNWN